MIPMCTSYAIISYRLTILKPVLSDYNIQKIVPQPITNPIINATLVIVHDTVKFVV